MFSRQEARNGMHIIRKSMYFLLHYPAGLFISLFTIACDSTLILLVLYIEYYKYNVSIFDSASFYQLLELDIWAHFYRVILYLSILFISFLLKNILMVLFTKNLLTYFRKKNNILTKKAYFIAKTLHIIMLLSVIHTFSAFNIFLEYIFVQTTIQKFLNFLQGKKSNTCNYTNSTTGSLFLPILIDQKKPSIARALQESETLLMQTFGEKIESNFSFFWIDILLIISLFTTLGAFIIYYHSLITACFITFLCYIMMRTLINYLIIIFKTALYEYVVHNNQVLFTKKEYHKYFAQ